jgi:hypothetical protein
MTYALERRLAAGQELAPAAWSVFRATDHERKRRGPNVMRRDHFDAVAVSVNVSDAPCAMSACATRGRASFAPFSDALST